MRVTFVLPFFSRRPIGGLRAVYEFASGMARRGHDIVVVHPKSLPTLSVKQTLRQRFARGLDHLAATRRIPWIEVDHRVTLSYVPYVGDDTIPESDAVFATSWQTAEPVALLSEKKGRKHYLVMDFYPYLASREVLEATWRLGFRIATISRWLETMVRKAGVDSANVSTVSCGISAVHCLRVPPENREASIVMMYGTASYKAANDGLSAISLARSEYGPVPVKLFGPNSRRRPRELPNWAHYFPLLSDQEVSDLYNSCAVFVSSSVAEGFCLPAAEAMASGCAVVATDCGGIRDFAVDGTNALLSPSSRPVDLAKNIVQVMRDRELRLRLAGNALLTISQQRWDRSVDRLERFLLRDSVATLPESKYSD